MARSKEFPVDKVGREIKPGSYIVYGHAIGRSASLRIAIVRKVNKRDFKYHTQIINDDERWSFRIRAIDDDSVNFLHMPEEYRKPTLLKKDSTLLYSSRIIVLDDIPYEYKELFSTLERLKW